jgi:signal peptidase I
MQPTLQPGDFLVVRDLRAREPHTGQVVVIRSGQLEIVKRIVAMPGERSGGLDDYWVEGDNAATSTDSRSSGPVSRDAIVGVVRARYKPVRGARLF